MYREERIVKWYSKEKRYTECSTRDYSVVTLSELYIVFFKFFKYSSRKNGSFEVRIIKLLKIVKSWPNDLGAEM